MQTYAAWLSSAQVQLADQESGRLEAELLLADVLKKDRTYLYTWPEKTLLDKEWLKLEALLKRRLTGEPVAYILGRKDFWSLSLKVNASVLIPRPETELLVELAISKGRDKNCKVMDLGVGSGAIILALKKERPAWECWACDQSIEALALAKVNANKNNLLGIEFVQSDWFSNIKERNFDLIVSNPPYIDQEDKHLQEGDVRFEPRTALVANQNGLEDILKITEQSKSFLKSGGYLLLEHGFSQGNSVRETFLNQGYVEVDTHRDLAGLDRVTCGRWNFNK